MAKDKVTIELATQEVTKWLDFKRLSNQRREDKKDSIDVLIGAMVDGTVVIDDGNITQTLKIPVTEGDQGAQELKYKARLSAGQIQACLQGSKIGDGYGVIIALASVLTGYPKALIKCIDSEDMTVVQAIANFFL